MEQKIENREIQENVVLQLREGFENETVMMRCPPFSPYGYSLKYEDKKNVKLVDSK